MRFRTRLALFLGAAIVAVQLLSALALFSTTRTALIAQLKSALSSAAVTAERQLNDIGQRVAESVRVLSLDYALRTAIAEQDRATVLSALRNHGKRVGATRMMLIGLDGVVAADTGDSNSLEGTVAFPDLLERASEGNAAAVVALGAGAYWMIIVPVLAPVPIAFIAAGIPVDDALLKQLQELSSLPYDLELAIERSDGSWSVVARSDEGASVATQLLKPGQAPEQLPDIISVNQHNYVALTRPLGSADRRTPVFALLAYPIDRALQPYQPLITALIAMLGAGLVAAVGGAVLIAGRVARPIEALANVARRIEGGDYAPPALPEQGGEIGKLATAIAGMARAIGEREEQIRQQARHDQLTSLPNRVAMEALIASTLGSTAPPTRAALLMVGLGRLAEIVKTVGHEIGDNLTQAAATRLRSAAPEDFLARVGDTNFAIWLPDADPDEARTLARSIIARLQRRYHETTVTVDIAASVGVALYPLHGSDGGVLLRRAEVALFSALTSPNRLATYDPVADPHRPERLALMSELREGIRRGELTLNYQPKLHLANSRIDGAEALVRWHHPARGFIAPDSFIGLAEETGNIGHLTEWALKVGCAQAAEWDKRGLAIRLAINLSVKDLADPELPRRIHELLASYYLLPQTITLEITESAIMGEPDTAIGILRELADSGIALAIDDFGVGQSSFSYLRRLPVRELKIDKAFILNLSQSPEDRTIVRSIVELGHHLDYVVTAEGVEDETALAFLEEIGCDYAQGYHIARAMPADLFDAALEDPRWPAREKLRS
jgi:diguanylate cyclase (GGDEF)-like protein